MINARLSSLWRPPFQTFTVSIQKVLKEMLHLPAHEITIKHRDATNWFEGYYLEASIALVIFSGGIDYIQIIRWTHTDDFILIWYTEDASVVTCHLRGSHTFLSPSLLQMGPLFKEGTSCCIKKDINHKLAYQTLSDHHQSSMIVLLGPWRSSGRQ